MNYENFQHKKDDKIIKNIFLVNMTNELDYHFSQLMLKGIQKYLNQGKNIGILVNKKGYSTGIICHSCGHIPQCKKCSVSISYHKQVDETLSGLCHICKTQYNYPTTCSECNSEKIKPFGMGTQKVAEYIHNEFGLQPIIIESETVNSPNKAKNVLQTLSDHLKSGSIIIGTSLLNTPIKDYPFDLMIFLNADLGLNIPDYNASKNNFHFLYDTFTKHTCKNFIVQSLNPDHYSIRQACKLDKAGFEKEDNQFRKEHIYPPFGELCVLLYKNEIEATVFNKIDQVHKELLYLKEKYGLKELEIYSTPPLVYKKFGKYRYNIILKNTANFGFEKEKKETVGALRNFLDIAYTKLNLQSKGFKIDRMADSII